MVLLKNYKEAQEYLTSLKNLLERSGFKDLSALIGLESKFIQNKEEAELPFAGLSVGPSGFPSVPSLTADVESIYDSSKRFVAEARKTLENVASGKGAGENNSFSMCVPLSEIGPFVEPTVVGKEDEYLEVQSHSFNESDDWFVFSSKKNVGKIEFVKRTILQSFTENYDEFLVGGAAVGTSLLLSPLIGLALPVAFYALKYSKDDGAKGYFLSDFARAVKSRVSGGKRQLKKILTMKEGKTEESETSFRFFYPVIDDVSGRVLVYRINNEQTIIGENKLIEGIKQGIKIDSQMPTTLLGYANGSRSYVNEGLKVSDEAKRVILKIRPKKKHTPPKTLIELGKEQKKALEKIVTEISEINKALDYIDQDTSRDSFVLPERVFADIYGLIYPLPSFWFSKVGEEEKCLDMNKRIVQYLLGDERTTDLFSGENIDFFTKRFSYGSDYGKTPSFLDRLFFFVGKPQFDLDGSVNDINKNMLIGCRKNIMEKIKNFAKNKEKEKVLGNFCALGNANFFGPQKGFLDKTERLRLLTSQLDKMVKSGNIRKENFDSSTAEVEKLQKEIYAEFGVRSGDNVMKFAKELRELSEMPTYKA